MRRRLFTMMSAFSLLLFAAVVVFWVRGYSGLDDVGWYTVRWPDEMNRDRREYQPRSVHGFWVLCYVRNDFRLAFPGDTVDRLAQAGEVERFREQNPAGHVFILPWWFLTAATAALPMWWFSRIRRQARRARFGRSLSCGYDLRETLGAAPSAGRLLPR